MVKVGDRILIKEKERKGIVTSINDIGGRYMIVYMNEKGKEEKDEGADTFRFNIVPIPQTSSIESPAQLDDIVRFRVREE